jgi:DNA-binding transcriptional MerR regulator
MSTSTDRVMRSLARYFEVAAEGREDTHKVEAAARRASADPEFRDALTLVLEASWTACLPRGSMSACTRLKGYDGAGIDMIIRLPGSTGCSTEQVYVLQAKVSEAAGPDPGVRSHLAGLLVAAIYLEWSSFGTEEARRLRSQPSAGDVIAVRDAWTRLTAVDGAPSTLPTHEDLCEKGIGGDLAPDPLRARTVAEFVDMLRKFRIWAGKPSYREIAHIGRPPVAASTIAAALNGKRLPTLYAVTALVTGCGGSKKDLDAFTTAWRRVHPAGRLPGQRNQEPIDEPGGLNAPVRGQHPASRADQIPEIPEVPRRTGTAEIGYRAPAACAAAGITYRQLDYWARTGLVEPSVRASHGPGTSRLYSFRDILMLKVVKRLLDTRVSLQQIRAAVQHLHDRGSADLAQVTLMSDGVSVYECTATDEVVDLLQGGEGVFGIALGRVWREVEGDLAVLPAIRAEDGLVAVPPGGARFQDDPAKRRQRRTS